MELRERNYDEATTWLARLRADDVSESVHLSFANWLLEDEANKPAFDAMLQIWEDLGVVKHLQPANYSPSNLNHGAATSLNTASGNSRQSAPDLQIYGPWALVASLVLAFSALLMFQNTGVEHTTAVGQFDQIVLDDGSRVMLNSDTVISINYTKQNRIVRLIQGEAYFEVVRDPNRPFIVHGRHGSAEAIGTSFDVWETDAGTRVTVTEGLVQVANGAQNIGVTAGQQAMIYTDRIKASLVDARAVTAWRTGRLEFDGVSLEALIEDINRYTTRKVVLAQDDPELRNSRVSAIFEIGDQDAMLLALQKSLELPITYTFSSDNRIHIIRTN